MPFDEWHGTIPNDEGRVLDPAAEAPSAGRVRRRLDQARAESGVIGTNKRDAQETVDNVFEDIETGRLHEPSQPDRDATEEWLAERKPELVTYAGWEAIDAAEKAAGEPQGRPRVKLCTFEELLDAAKAATPAP